MSCSWGRVQEKGVCFGVDHVMRHAIDRMLSILLHCKCLGSILCRGDVKEALRSSLAIGWQQCLPRGSMAPGSHG